LVVHAVAALNPHTSVRLHTGQRLYVGLASTVGRSIWLRGVYEQEVENHLRRLLRPGDTFVDVGANVGYFSLIAGQLVGATGQVHSFEPDDSARAMLERSIADNELHHVNCHPVALWSKDVALGLMEKADSAYNHVEAAAFSRQKQVRGVDFDSYAESVGMATPIRLLKIDVEGAEVEVLRGMGQTLARDRPALIVEAQDATLARSGYRLEDIFSLLDRHSYVGTTADGRAAADAHAARGLLAGALAPNLVFEAR
jgi:FkbM family methyltransferase